MTLTRNLWLWAVIMLLAQPGMAGAASDVFMCVSGIQGGSADQEFEGCSEIVGVSYAVGVEGGAAPPSSGGGRAAPASCGLYEVSKPIDLASVPLLIRTLLGRHTASVEFAVRTPGPEPLVFFELTLSDVLMVEVEQNLASAAEAPLEKIVMQPGQVEWRFTPQDETGAAGAPIERGFDCVRNRRL
jgi:type VI secretion system secreted protein Hcp